MHFFRVSLFSILFVALSFLEATAAGSYAVWATGSNNFGQLGDGTTTNRLSPVQVASGVATVSAGYWHSFYVKTDDGAFIYIEYQGRGEMATGTLAVAPTFQTGSEKYKWLNRVQAVSAGNVNLKTGDLVYQLYEVKVSI